MSNYIVVETEGAAAMVTSVIPVDKLESVKVVVSGRLNSALPYAKSIALSKRASVSMIVDAKTEDKNYVAQQEREYAELAGSVSLVHPLVVMLGVPTVEASLRDPVWKSKVGAFVDGAETAPTKPAASPFR